jgi:CelD/BcsL family acetyltransferase involved in cellulose biosynthesis
VDAPVLELDGGWEGIEDGRLSTGRRRVLRKARKRLTALGDVKLERVEAADEVERALGDAFRLHRLRWTGRPDGSGFATPVGVRFHRAALGALAARRIVRLSLMRVDGRAIAFALDFVVADHLYTYRTGFDPAFGRYSPGVLLLHEVIAGAADEGIRRVELLGAAASHKAAIADRLEPLHLGLGLAGSPRGRVVVRTRIGALGARERLRASAGAQRAYAHVRPLLARWRSRHSVLSG